MKLYHIPTTRSLRPRWLLEEMELPYELVRVSLADTEQPNYRQKHPQGKVPVLEDGETVMFESGAICAYLADRYPERGVAPLPGSSARAAYYQWLFYATATLEPPVEAYLFYSRPEISEKVLPKPQPAQTSGQQLQQWFEQAALPLRQTLAARSYLVGDGLTAADVVVGGVLLWARFLDMLASEPVLREYLERLRARAAFARAKQD